MVDAEETSQPASWGEQDSLTFLDYGRYFVPAREFQIAAICDLIPDPGEPFTIIELCCGEGLLSGALLQRFPVCRVRGYDGSTEMLRHARTNLADYADRFQAIPFDLADRSWRDSSEAVHAIVSSLAIHHLDGSQKRELFADLYRLLWPGGVVVIADLVQPAHGLGVELAARTWDAEVRRRAIELDGNPDAFAFFERERWNIYRYPDDDDIDKPSRLIDQLLWLSQAGFAAVDVYWMYAGHAIFGGIKEPLAEDHQS